jgi:hypothetical protein
MVTAMDFILGVIVGVFGLLVIPLHFSNKAAKAKPAANVTPSAVGVDMFGKGGISIEALIPNDALKRVFRQLKNGIS